MFLGSMAVHALTVIFLGLISLRYPSMYRLFIPFCRLPDLIHFVVGPSYHYDSKFEPLRKNSLPFPFKLFGSNFYRDD